MRVSNILLGLGLFTLRIATKGQKGRDRSRNRSHWAGVSSVEMGIHNFGVEEEREGFAIGVDRRLEQGRHRFLLG